MGLIGLVLTNRNISNVVLWHHRKCITAVGTLRFIWGLDIVNRQEIVCHISLLFGVLVGCVHLFSESVIHSHPNICIQIVYCISMFLYPKSLEWCVVGALSWSNQTSIWKTTQISKIKWSQCFMTHLQCTAATWLNPILKSSTLKIQFPSVVVYKRAFCRHMISIQGDWLQSCALFCSLLSNSDNG